MGEAKDPKREDTVTKLGESFDNVFKEELKCVNRRWGKAYEGQDGKRPVRRLEERTAAALDDTEQPAAPTTANNLVGLAFSGGGIRSATINMGIAQALHRRGIFDHVDYMSTVSGGGYLGSSISTAMRELPDDANAPKGKGEFPFAYREPEAPDETMAAGETPEVESKFLTWVRNNSNYMATGGFLDWPRIVGVLLRGMLANFLVLLPILLALAVGMVWHHSDTLAQWEKQDQELAALWRTSEKATENAQRQESWAIAGNTTAWVNAEQARVAAEQEAKDKEKAIAEDRAGIKLFRATAGVAGVFLLLVFIFPVLVRVYKVYKHEGVVETGEESSVDSRGNLEKAFGLVLVAIFAVAAIQALPLLIRWFHQIESSGLRGLYAGAGSGGALAVLTVAGKLLSSLGGLRQKVMLLLIGLLGLVIPLAVALYVADDLIYPVAGITVTDDAGYAAAFDKKSSDLAPAEVAEVEKLDVRTPAYLVPQWAHRPMQFAEWPSSDDVVRLLPGILLLIMGGGLGAAVVGRTMKKPGAARAVVSLLGIIAGAFVGYLLLIGSSGMLARLCTALGFSGIRPDVLVLSMAVVVLVFCWAAIDVNLTGVLGLYRDRLAGAYLIGVRKKGTYKKGADGKPEFVPETNGHGEPTNAEQMFVEPDLNLEELCGGGPPCKASKAPYHIVNTALNLQGSDDPMLRDRGSDFFMFSKLYYGGHRTGYCQTGLLEKVFPQMDLPTAMAISAAAASPNSGRATSKPLVALMTLLNVRLGYWVPHPGRLFKWLNDNGMVGKDAKKPKIHHRWGWRIPPWALLKEMASAVHAKAKWVNLSDGGHIENLATYELLRRRCKYIICGDGEADPTLTFGGLAILMRSARIDMGIEIEILLDDLRLGDNGKSRQHAALGRIVYPSRHRRVRSKTSGTCPVCQDKLIDTVGDENYDDTEKYLCPKGEVEYGHLLYLKSSFTGNEDETMQEYRAKSADFPHESTADQFFDEGQFEAYRALGFHMADGLFPALADGEDPKVDWVHFKRWFKQLRADLAPRLSAKHTALQEQLHKISELLQEERFHSYFYELYPHFDSRKPDEKKADSQKEARMPEVTYLLGLQLDLMESAFLSLNLDQPVNWNHPGNAGWRTLFESWAGSPDEETSFREAYLHLGVGYSGRFQNFCRETLKLKTYFRKLEEDDWS